jgi:hypothetical protein
MSETTCVLCQADFRPEALITSVGGLKKCKSCESQWPLARTKAEIQVKRKDKARTMDEARVLELIYEVLETANIKRQPCATCGTLFFRNKPMQTLCNACEVKTKAKKETK